MATIPGKKSKGLSTCPKPNPGPRPLGFQPLRPRLPSRPPPLCALPAPPHARRARSRAGLEGGARACEGGRRGGRGRSAAWARAQAPFWDPLPARILMCCRPRGKKPAVLGFGTAPPGWGGAGHFRACAQLVNGLPGSGSLLGRPQGLRSPACRLAWGSGAGRGGGGGGGGALWQERLVTLFLRS